MRHCSAELRRRLSKANRGQIPWNKGKHHSEATKRKMRVAHLGVPRPDLRGSNHYLFGKHVPVETRRKMSAASRGEKNPNFGKTSSTKTRALMSRSHIGKTQSAETRKRIGNANRGDKGYWFGKHLSTDTCIKLSKKRRGEKHWNWQGGTASYPPTWTAILRRYIRERDNYTCQGCGAQQSDRAFDVHHIDYVKSHCDPQNLITLCKNCHSKTNTHHWFWPALFRAVMGR